MAEIPTTQSRGSGLKIIGAGFGRTGTLSLKVALEELGLGPCYHMSELIEKPEHLVYWEAASRGESIDWNNIFAGYSATVDWPGCSFYEQLLQAYPQAKVILTIRNPENWYESASSTIFQMRNKSNRSPIESMLFSVLGAFNHGMRPAARIMSSPMIDRTIGQWVEDKQEAIAFFTEHIENVKQQVPAEKLLVYDVKEGWEPLCAFLGVEIPKDKSFPHLNDRLSFPPIKAMRLFRRRLIGISIVVGLLLAFLLFQRWQR